MDTKTHFSVEAIENLVNNFNQRKGPKGGPSIKGIRHALKHIAPHLAGQKINKFKSSLENDFDGEISISHLGKTEMDFEGGNISGSRIHIFVPTYKPLLEIIS